MSWCHILLSNKFAFVFFYPPFYILSIFLINDELNKHTEYHTLSNFIASLRLETKHQSSFL